MMIMAALAGLAVVGWNSTLAATITWVGSSAITNYASNTNNWSPCQIPVSTDAILLDSSTTNRHLTWDSPSNGLPDTVALWLQTNYTGTVTILTTSGGTFTNFTITSNLTIAGGTWQHQDNGSAETFHLKVTVGGNATIESGGKIDVTGKGYDFGQGPGYSAGGYQGAGHGGLGGVSSRQDTPGSKTYGSVTAPTNIGSGGRTLSSATGGGAVKLTVSGNTTLNGSIKADGNYVPATAGDNSPGSGGSVWLVTSNLAGSGSVSANGGDSPSGYGGGGGGRISVILTSGDSFDQVTCNAYGGTSILSAAYRDRGGAGGTIYLETHSQSNGHGTLVVDNGAARYHHPQVTTAMPSNQSWAFDSLRLTNGGILDAAPGTTLNLTNTSILTDATNSDGIRLSGGAVTIPAAFVVSNWSLITDTNYTFACNLTVANGGKITHTLNETREAFKIDLTINGNLTIDNGGTVDVSSKGYAGDYGTGCSGAGSYGSAYGGLGGLISSNDTSRSSTYGSILAPTNIGSGGVEMGEVCWGGGAVKLTVMGTTALDGTIKADGYDVPSGADDSSGSGGSVYLITSNLTGSGSISAKGGDQLQGFGSGGGGRIAVVLTGANSFDGVTATAYGGESPTVSRRGGGAGTVYWQTAFNAGGRGFVMVDNSNRNYLCTNAMTSIPPITNRVDDLSNTTWTNRNGGRIRVETNQTIKALTLADTNTVLELAGHTLTTYGLTITNRVYSPAVYTTNDLPPMVRDAPGGGKLVVLSQNGTVVKIW